jgi:hypothetical protein
MKWWCEMLPNTQALVYGHTYLPAAQWQGEVICCHQPAKRGIFGKLWHVR